MLLNKFVKKERGYMKKFCLFFLLLSICVKAQTTLSAGEVIILEFNGNGTDGFTFMPLVHLAAGTKINFTDYGWNGTTNSFHIAEEGNASGGGNMITYTAPSKITAGTLIRQDKNGIGGSAFTEDTDYSSYNFNHLNYIYALHSLNNGHDGILVFQGTPSDPTFIWGYHTGQWGKGLYSDYYWSDLPSTLENGTNALFFSDLTSGTDLTVDDGYYNGITTATTMAGWRQRVANSANWTTLASGTAPTLLFPNTFGVTDALPVELVSFIANNINGNIVLNWQTATEINNYGFEIERSQNNSWETIGFVQGHGNCNSPIDYSYSDKPTGHGTYKYRLKQIDTDGQFVYSPIVEANIDIPLEFGVKQNFPNPFNPITTIQYSIPIPNMVSLKVFDVLGNEVANLVNEYKNFGSYEVNFDGSKLSSGTYFYRLEAGTSSETKKLLLLK